MKRCFWVPEDNELYQDYHDKEWGVPVHDDRTHFEYITLEGAQAGLSWLTVLKRREGYRKAFANFDPAKVAKFTQKQMDDLMHDEGIIRNKLKIQSTVENAKQFLKIQKEFGSFDKYIWGFVNGKTIHNKWKSKADVPAETDISKAISKDLKKRGFNFVGSTIMYAYMQAVGLVNDHSADCFRCGK